jgi:guanylate kinase
MIKQGKVVVLEIEVNGALQVKDKFPEAVLVFLMPPTFLELSRRLQNRNTEDAVAIEDRLKKAEEEITLIPRYQYLVVNDVVDRAVERIEHIVNAERLKPMRCAEEIEFFRRSK